MTNSPRSAAAERAPARTRPFEVRIGGARHGAFKALEDAIAAAKIAKRETPHALVGVIDATSGQRILEVDF
ncbi:MAG: hypothetical protein WAT67_04240 [Candidatus Contendobacter sp.]